jgi:hypothetical protein
MLIKKAYIAFILLSHPCIQANEFSANIINDTSRLVSGGIHLAELILKGIFYLKSKQ